MFRGYIDDVADEKIQSGDSREVGAGILLALVSNGWKYLDAENCRATRTTPTWARLQRHRAAARRQAQVVQARFRQCRRYEDRAESMLTEVQSLRTSLDDVSFPLQELHPSVGRLVGPSLSIGVEAGGEASMTGRDLRPSLGLRIRSYLLEVSLRQVGEPSQDGAFDVSGGFSLFDGWLLNPFVHGGARFFSPEEGEGPIYECDSGDVCVTKPYAFISMGNHFSFGLGNTTKIGLPIELSIPFSDRLDITVKVALSLPHIYAVSKTTRSIPDWTTPEDRRSRPLDALGRTKLCLRLVREPRIIVAAHPGPERRRPER